MIDTNALLDLLLERDADRAHRVEILIARHKKDIHISDLAVQEIVYVLEKYYGFPRPLVVSNLEKLFVEQKFALSRSLFTRAVVDYLAHPSLSFVDACLLTQAELDDDLPLWTFDKKLVNQSGDRAQLLK